MCSAPEIVETWSYERNTLPAASKLQKESSDSCIYSSLFSVCHIQRTLGRSLKVKAEAQVSSQATVTQELKTYGDQDLACSYCATVQYI